jgi:predicted kinase
MLIVLSGLPGSGKTTIGKALAGRLAAIYVRVDEIEHALRQHPGFDQEIGSAGYAVAFAIASSNLRLGNRVVADSVNPVPESRQGWRDVVHAIDGTYLLEIEVICSDEKEHKRRVEQRVSDIGGFTLPDWSSITSHDYSPWTEPRLIVDTALLSVGDAVSAIDKRLEAIAQAHALSG